MNDTGERALVERRLQRWLRDVRRFLRDEASDSPSADLLCVWIELAYVLESYGDVTALYERLVESEADPWLAQRVRRLAATAKVKGEVSRTAGGAS